MKKYSTPAVRVVVIDDSDLICSSPESKMLYGGGQDSGHGVAEGRSRGWDDEEDW